MVIRRFVGTVITASIETAAFVLTKSNRQAEDRLHRIGQTKSVTAYYLLAAGTIEERIMGMLRSKIEVTSTVMEGRPVALLDALIQQLA